MTISMYQASAPRFAHALKSLSAVLGKAQAHYRNARKGLDELAVGKRGRPPIHPQYLAKIIDEVAAEDAVFTCDVGETTVWAARYLHLNGRRRLLGEAAWCYRFRPAVRYPLKTRQQGLPPKVVEISWKAQMRLCTRYRRMVTRGKTPQKVVIAVARELLAFMWAIGVEVEQQHGPTRVAA